MKRGAYQNNEERPNRLYEQQSNVDIEQMNAIIFDGTLIFSRFFIWTLTVCSFEFGHVHLA